MECAEVEGSKKRQLERIYKSLNPGELRRKIVQLQEELYERNWKKEEVFV
ncbi:MAG: hypothetical protein NC824_01920 [Candidatus Omnitrophica bacterium]|nr:hypothetical protein [Candidatus Omnitrophota bacterium]